ncbi:MAG: DUF4294 domain-containing protein [Paludibacteraceae bacterium]
MPKYLIYCLCLLSGLSFVFEAQGAPSIRYGMKIEGSDTTRVAFISDIYVFPPMRFKNKKQERFYWRTVRDVKKTLPIAKILTQEMKNTDEVMSKMNKREQRRFWKQYEKVLYMQYEDKFRHMTAAQGQMLMKLIDRECGRTSYNVIRFYKGGFVANFWQMVAKMVGNDLKEEYDGTDKDQITERIILLVEAGQL